ncbi:MAG: hypothetical protein J5950_04650 [Clostridia bacterium]|nr:hypothetical protein [Clostridia bacterium]
MKNALKPLDRICFKSIFYLKELKARFRERVVKSIDAMGTIEVIMIIAVLVALALIFRNFIGNLASKIFNKIQEKTDTAIDDL